MSPPTLYQARAICESVGARAVIVIALDHYGNIAGSSYGQTKLGCRQTAYTLDCIVDAMGDGYIPVWATEQSEIAKRKRVAVQVAEMLETDPVFHKNFPSARRLMYFFRFLRTRLNGARWKVIGSYFTPEEVADITEAL